MTLNEKETEWIKRKIRKYYTGKFSVEDREFQERALERRADSIIRSIEEIKPANFQEFVEKELKRLGYREEIDSLRYEIRATKHNDKTNLEDLGKRIHSVESKVKKEDPEYLPIIQKFITIVAVELKQKKEGVDVRKFHVQAKR
jgi:hypothetical protein